MSGKISPTLSIERYAFCVLDKFAWFVAKITKPPYSACGIHALAKAYLLNDSRTMYRPYIGTSSTIGLETRTHTPPSTTKSRARRQSNLKIDKETRSHKHRTSVNNMDKFQTVFSLSKKKPAKTTSTTDQLSLVEPEDIQLQEIFFSPTWSYEKNNEIRELMKVNEIGAGAADCGQYASGMLVYQTAPLWLDGRSLQESDYQLCNPPEFSVKAGMMGDFFAQETPPQGAKAVAFNTYCVTPDSTFPIFHYAKIERDKNQNMTHLTHTDANRYALQAEKNLPVQGGQFSVFSSIQEEPLARYSVMQPQRLDNLQDFVNYCTKYYDADKEGLFYFCTFKPL